MAVRLLEHMIRQQVGDLLEIEYEGKFYYLVVLTKIVLFGGNIVFAFHGTGSKRRLAELLASRRGFNVCTDLLMPKKEGTVTRLHRFEDVSGFWLTRYIKSTLEHRLGHRAKRWTITRIDEPDVIVARRRWMPRRYREAMDDGTYSFDLVAEKILASYTPDQNPFL